jgi:hypothetical protein
MKYCAATSSSIRGPITLIDHQLGIGPLSSLAAGFAHYHLCNIHEHPITQLLVARNFPDGQTLPSDKFIPVFYSCLPSFDLCIHPQRSVDSLQRRGHFPKRHLLAYSFILIYHRPSPYVFDGPFCCPLLRCGYTEPFVPTAYSFESLAGAFSINIRVERAPGSSNRAEHELESQDREEYELKSHDREEYELKSHDREEHELKSHDREEYELKSHDREEHGLERPDCEEHEPESHDRKEHELETPDREEYELKSHDREEHGLERPDCEEHEPESHDRKEHGLETPDREEHELKSHDRKGHGLETPDCGEYEFERPDCEEHGLERPDCEEYELKSQWFRRTWIRNG